jgi:monofunctional biosynthetic peptidoglycan transglycosylase
MVAKKLPRSGRKRARRVSIKRGLKLFLTCFLLPLLIVTVLQVLILKYVNPPMTTSMAFHWLKLKVGTADQGLPQYKWRTLASISPHLIRAVLAAEDQRFLFHRGFDFVEMNEALKDMVTGERIRGASTISMQTARTIFLWQSRSLLRKTLEAYYTVLIELTWGKRRILELYLNTVDWGKGMVGAEAAAKGYFNKTAAAINAEEGALLAAILPSPHNWSPLHPTGYVIERQSKILKDMKHVRVP